MLQGHMSCQVSPMKSLAVAYNTNEKLGEASRCCWKQLAFNSVRIGLDLTMVSAKTAFERNMSKR